MPLKRSIKLSLALLVDQINTGANLKLMPLTKQFVVFLIFIDILLESRQPGATFYCYRYIIPLNTFLFLLIKVYLLSAKLGSSDRQIRLYVLNIYTFF